MSESYRIVRWPQRAIIARYPTVSECKAFIDGLHVAHGEWTETESHPLGECLTHESSERPDERVWIEAAAP